MENLKGNLANWSSNSDGSGTGFYIKRRSSQKLAS